VVAKSIAVPGYEALLDIRISDIVIISAINRPVTFKRGLGGPSSFDESGIAYSQSTATF
jgi:hypothetical protein